MIRLRIARALFLLSTFSSSAHAGAWLQPEGKGLAVAQASRYKTSHYFDSVGNQQSQQPFTKYELNPYLEYGWSDSTTIGANLFLDYATQPQATTAGTIDGSNYGLVDSELFSRGKLYESDGVIVSYQPLIKLPSLFEKDTLPKTGSNAWDAEISLFGGYGFALFGEHHFAETRIGYRHRLGEREDQLKLDAKLGVSLSREWQISPALYYTTATQNSVPTTFSQNGTQDYDLLKGELSLAYTPEGNYKYLASIFSHLSGQNTGAGAGAMFGIGYSF